MGGSPGRGLAPVLQQSREHMLLWVKKLSQEIGGAWPRCTHTSSTMLHARCSTGSSTAVLAGLGKAAAGSQALELFRDIGNRPVHCSTRKLTRESERLLLLPKAGKWTSVHFASAGELVTKQICEAAPYTHSQG